MAMTLKELLTSGCQTSPDGKHWEPALPMAGFFIERLRDAWEVLQGRATAIRATPAAPLPVARLIPREPRP
jgi:hypothetical protein